MSENGSRAIAKSEGEETLLRIARAALAAYDLPPHIEVRPIRLSNNAVFEEHVQSELTFLQTLADEVSGTPVELPRPVAARGGELMVCVGGQGADAALPGRYCDLLTWIDGSVLAPSPALGEDVEGLLERFDRGLLRLEAAALHAPASRARQCDNG